MEKRILKIENNIPLINQLKKTRVAAYARVSTDKDEQQNSLQAQKDYFTLLIESNVTWEFVGIYFDDGISGLNHKNRDGFNNMVEDALDGKIDFIVTKSISRFARNTLDSLEVLRKLKDKGIGVYFQKENINTLDGKGEFVLTLMASFAQEESRSISENVTWAKRKGFIKGNVSIPFKHTLGFKMGNNGEILIDRKEARIVEFIYYMAVLDYSPSQIASKLEKNNIPSPAGNPNWYTSSVKNIISNEKYKGDAILQKTFTVNYLTKEKKRNDGELPMYYVENSHESIISKGVTESLVDYLDKFNIGTNRPHGLSEKIVCGECGAIFGSFRIHPERHGGKIAWRCRNKYSKENKCNVRHLYEDCIYETLESEIALIINKRLDLRKEVYKILKLKGDPIYISNDNFVWENDDIDSITKRILVSKDHDAKIEFIDGTVTKTHIDGTGIKQGRRKASDKK